MGTGVNCSPTVSSTSAPSPSLPSPVVWFLLHSFPLLPSPPDTQIPPPLTSVSSTAPWPFAKVAGGKPGLLRTQVCLLLSSLYARVPIPGTLPCQGCVSTYKSPRPDSALCPDGALFPEREQRASQNANPRQPVLWLMPMPNYAHGSVGTVEMPGTGCYPRLKTIWLCPLASSEENTLECLAS